MRVFVINDEDDSFFEYCYDGDSKSWTAPPSAEDKKAAIDTLTMALETLKRLAVSPARIPVRDKTGQTIFVEKLGLPQGGWS